MKPLTLPAAPMPSVQTTPSAQAIQVAQNMPNMQNAPSAAPTGLQLNDIHLPEPISQYPIALGWWLLVALIIVLITWLVIKFRQKKQRNKNKKIALKQLSHTEQATRSQNIELLKWAAIQYFDRQLIAKMYGAHFQDFLIAQLPKKHQTQFDSLSKQAFSEQYQASSDTVVDEDFSQAAILWLTHALPPIKKQQQSTNSLNTMKTTVEQPVAPPRVKGAAL